MGKLRRACAREGWSRVPRLQQQESQSDLPPVPPPTPTAQTLPGDVSFLEGLASLDFPIQTSWGSLPKTGPEIRWKWGNLSKGLWGRNYERISWEEVQQLTNRNSRSKEWREQEISYQRSNRNILKITEISQKRWAWISRFKDSKEWPKQTLKIVLPASHLWEASDHWDKEEILRASRE